MGVSTSPSNRLLIILGIAGGVIFVIWALVDTPFPIYLPAIDSSSGLNALYAFARFIGSLSLLFILLGLIVAYSSPLLPGGSLSMLGWIVASLTTTLLAGVFFYQGLIIPVASTHAQALLDPAGSAFKQVDTNILLLIWAILFAIGYVIFGITLLRSPSKLRWAGLLILVGALLFATGSRSRLLPDILPVLGAVIFGVGHILLNAMLLTRKAKIT